MQPMSYMPSSSDTFRSDLQNYHALSNVSSYIHLLFMAMNFVMSSHFDDENEFVNTFNLVYVLASVSSCFQARSWTKHESFEKGCVYYISFILNMIGALSVLVGIYCSFNDANLNYMFQDANMTFNQFVWYVLFPAFLPFMLSMTTLLNIPVVPTSQPVPMLVNANGVLQQVFVQQQSTPQPKIQVRSSPYSCMEITAAVFTCLFVVAHLTVMGITIWWFGNPLFVVYSVVELAIAGYTLAFVFDKSDRTNMMKGSIPIQVFLYLNYAFALVMALILPLWSHFTYGADGTIFLILCLTFLRTTILTGSMSTSRGTTSTQTTSRSSSNWTTLSPKTSS